MRTLAPLMLVTILVCSGCQEGGPFFSGIEQFIAKEGMRGNDLVPSLNRYRSAESDRRGALVAQGKAFVEKEKVESRDVGATLDRYKAKEIENWPHFKTMADGSMKCDDGGNFFRSIGQFVDKQGRQGEELVPELTRFRDMELEKPGALNNQTRAYVAKEKVEGRDIPPTLQRYKAQELEAWDGFRSDIRKGVNNEMLQKQEAQETLRRYRTKETDLMPKFGVMTQKAEKLAETSERKFPTTSDY